jgi:hypothetical protein
MSLVGPSYQMSFLTVQDFPSASARVSSRPTASNGASTFSREGCWEAENLDVRSYAVMAQRLVH